MKSCAFELLHPKSLEEAVDVLASGDADTKILAGGQSLVPMLNLRMAVVDRLVDLRDLTVLRQADDVGDESRLGACVTHGRIQNGNIPDTISGLLPAVARSIAYQPIRNRGTLGGSLALADPSADWPAVCTVLGAIIEWQGPDGRSECAAEKFFMGPYMTRLGVADVLTSVRIPRLDSETRWGIWKLVRKSGEFAHAMAIVVRTPTESRAVLGATGSRPFRLPAVEAVLGGLRNWTKDTVKATERAFDEDVAAEATGLDEVHAWQLRTCLMRAAGKSFDATPSGNGEF